MTHRQLRTCVGCRELGERANLVRYVLVDQVPTRDDAATMAGRGAWLHDTEACRDVAARRHALQRALRSGTLGAVGRRPHLLD